MPQQPREGTAPAPRRRHLGLLSHCAGHGLRGIKVVRAERNRGTAAEHRTGSARRAKAIACTRRSPGSRKR
ncbi:hypothetical protein D1J63_26460 [Streptomyces sp. KPB2]|nr:hypothetical protein D1J63_26460 [Streptomyces sp. KPB2]